VSELPEWPRRSSYEHESKTFFGKPIVYKRYVAYERALKEAYAARLHRAVAFIEHVEACSAPGEWPHDEATAARIAIGPLPGEGA
jgi:hypothetical protein